MTLDKTITNTVKINRFSTIMDELSSKYNGQYDYSKFIYSGMKKKGIIICRKHGEFSQNLSSHLASKHGCPKCGKESMGRQYTLSFTEFVKRSNATHKNFYIYSEKGYKKASEKATIVCPIHGIFNQLPSDHMKGRGCNKCARIVANSKITKSKDYFIIKANKKHNNKYNYSNTVYTGMKNKIIITCPHHGDFIQTPSDHIQGNGCQLCANNRKRAKYIEEPTILYYLYLPKFDVYKIGVTLVSRGIKKRYLPEKIEYKILKQVYFLSGKFAYKHEQEILHKYDQHRYVGKNIFKDGGTSECFINDILHDEDIA